jgi:hypothetical protein
MGWALQCLEIVVSISKKASVMNCPVCGKPAEVIDSRPKPDGRYRRYQCFNMHRFTTTEQVIKEGKKNGN